MSKLHQEMVTTTGTSIDAYLDWVRKELVKKDFGEVNICFVVKNGQVTDVRKTSMDHEHTPLNKL